MKDFRHGIKCAPGMLFKPHEPKGSQLELCQVYTSMNTSRTCFRCGGEFLALSARVCPTCRKPRTQAGHPSVNRPLTFREKQITQLVCKAKLNKEIAFELHLTEGTIKEYLNRIFRKLQVKNRTELAIWAVRNLQVAA
jgi:DNA-binding NarL/FixJ family response regulator